MLMRWHKTKSFLGGRGRFVKSHNFILIETFPKLSRARKLIVLLFRRPEKLSHGGWAGVPEIIASALVLFEFEIGVDNAMSTC